MMKEKFFLINKFYFRLLNFEISININKNKNYDYSNFLNYI